jgi:hypothetical protein
MAGEGSPIKPARRNVGKVERSTRSSLSASEHAGRRRAGGGGGGIGGSISGPQRPSIRRGISFSNVVDEREIPTVCRSKSNDFFYDDDEIANFRHEKFMEDCGLDPKDFE